MNHVEVKGDHMVVHFDHAEGLKTLNGKAPEGFWVADESATWVRADAELDGETVVLPSNIAEY